jgi:AcrR family transcriptional regulator
MTASTTKRTDPLSRVEIAQAALAMVDRDGVDKFSMRRLADDLGVTPMAVYHHFENKAEILQAAADQVWVEVVMSYVTDDDPVEELIQNFLITRRVFQRHADLTTYAFASPTTEEAVHVMALGIAAQFERAGFRGEDVGDAYFALATYTLGSGLLYAERVMLDRAIRGPVSELATLATEPIPWEAGGDAYRSVRAAMGDDADLARFERGLRSIMAALIERDVTS